MSAIKRLHCHSAFRHYDMFHCNRSSGYGNSVFNTTYNFNGGTMCGGGFWGGLLGGLGMGLGAGIMNLFGGGMFGGGLFGGGMFGGGMFGGGFPMMNWFGGNSSLSNWFGLGGKDKTNDKSAKSNADLKPIDKLEDRAKALEDASNIDAKKLAQLKKDIDNYALKDSVDTDVDNERLKKLKERVNKIKATEQAKESPASSEEKDLKSSLNNGETGDASLKAAQNQKVVGTPISQNVATVTSTQPAAKTDEQIIDEYLTRNGNYYVPKQKLTAEALKAISNKGISVKFAQHMRDNMIDTYIKGKAENIKTDSDGKLVSYEINCNDGSADNKLKLRYKVTIKDGKFNIVCISSEHSTAYTIYKHKTGLAYTEGNNGMLTATGNDTVVTTTLDGKDAADYVAITKKKKAS